MTAFATNSLNQGWATGDLRASSGSGGVCSTLWPSGSVNRKLGPLLSFKLPITDLNCDEPNDHNVKTMETAQNQSSEENLSINLAKATPQ